MIEAILYFNNQHVNAFTLHNTGRYVGNSVSFFGTQSTADYKMNPLGRHPFNIITEEIYD